MKFNMGNDNEHMFRQLLFRENKKASTASNNQQTDQSMKFENIKTGILNQTIFLKNIKSAKPKNQSNIKRQLLQGIVGRDNFCLNSKEYNKPLVWSLLFF